MNTRELLLHMYHSHAFVVWTFCLQTPVYCPNPSRFLWKCCRHYQSLLTGFNQHFSTVSKGVGRQFQRGERMGITTVLSHSHCTIESHRLFIIPSLHPVSSLAVRLSSLLLRCSSCVSVALTFWSHQGFRPYSEPPAMMELRSQADVSGQLACHWRDEQFIPP